MNVSGSKYGDEFVRKYDSDRMYIFAMTDYTENMVMDRMDTPQL